ncbi:MAG: hypothetical protein O4808_14475, partial [Trichodesmium sp. St17_bin3_1_1]|nr:hypothetical protein [Trichodesmium sp. St17_bin3_1_1]
MALLMVEKDKYDRLLKQQKTDDVPHKPEESDNRRHRRDMGEDQNEGRADSAAESPSSSEESESEDASRRHSVPPTDLPCRRKAKAASFLKRLASSHPASGVDGRNFIRLKGRKVAKVPTVLQHFYGAETLPARHARRLAKFVKSGDLRRPPSKTRTTTTAAAAAATTTTTGELEAIHPPRSRRLGRRFFLRREESWP